MYVVTQVFPNAVEIWDQVTKDEEAKPAGQMTIFMDETHEFRVGDEVQLTIKQTTIMDIPDLISTYPEEPDGRSGVREYGEFRDL